MNEQGLEMQVQKSILSLASPALRAALQVVSKGGMSKLIRAVYRASPLVLYLPAHLRLMRVLNAPPVSELVRRRPKLGYKYLYRPYLVQSLTRKTRLAILEHHYRYLSERVTSDFFARIYDERYELWRDIKAGYTNSITLAFPVDWEHDYEGDLLLTFHCDDEPIYSLTFSIVPGLSIGIDAEQLVLVTSIQGRAGMADRIKQVKENYGDLSPPMLLLPAIEGLALSMNIHLLGGIGLDQQVQKQTWGNESFTFDYDQFWRKVIGDRTNDTYYLRPIPEDCRPLEEIKAKHRKKTQFRRSIKASILEISRFNFQEKCLNTKCA